MLRSGKVLRLLTGQLAVTGGTSVTAPAKKARPKGPCRRPQADDGPWNSGRNILGDPPNDEPPSPPPPPPPPRSRRQDDGSPSGVVVGASAKSKSRPGGRTVASAAQSPGPSAESQPGASDDGPLSSNPLQAMAPTLNQLDKVVKEILDDCHVSLSTKLLALQLVEKFGYEGEMRLHRLLNLG
ncbi:unnamed protein product [Cladocopium goreaui]|uniref:Uncharacterized protein n=1 Tax=Cladocopium goreaui TaxID=2562237 RepID=A0A9P1CWM6_9DINO|nr:unnamed protein product [Cladocopium goreaui]